LGLQQQIAGMTIDINQQPHAIWSMTTTDQHKADMYFWW
jgi:hypothetical protein